MYLIGFCLFVVLQSFYINGVFELFRGKCTNDLAKGTVCDGNLGYKVFKKFIEKNKDKVWYLPIAGCVRCMSSCHSIYTFFPLVIYLFGFHWIEIFAWAFDAVILISVNAYLYKRL